MRLSVFLGCSPQYLLKQGFFIEPSLPSLLVLGISLCLPKSGITSYVTMSMGIYMSSGDHNSDPHDYMVGVYCTDIHSPPSFFLFRTQPSILKTRFLVHFIKTIFIFVFTQLSVPFILMADNTSLSAFLKKTLRSHLSHLCDYAYAHIHNNYIYLHIL